MHKFSFWFVVVSVLLISPTGYAETAAEKGERIAQQASDMDGDFQDYSVSGKMLLKTEGATTSEREFVSYFRDAGNNRVESVLVFRWPGNIRRTALLTHSFPDKADNQWLFLPALERTRRITSSGRSGSFVGSEFAYEDMVDQGPEKFQNVYNSLGSCPGGGQCHILDRVPVDDSGYSLQRAWLDTRNLRTQKVEYFDRNGKHVKTLRISGHKRFEGKYWRAQKMVMTNLVTQKSTELFWSEFVFDQGLPATRFTVNALPRVN